MPPPRFLIRAAKQILNSTTGQSRVMCPVPASWCQRLEDSVLILAAGMPRSASTWLYNAARLLLCSSPETARNFSCGWVGDLRTIPKKRSMLIKLHEFDSGLVTQSTKILYSSRDIQKALASSQRKFGNAPTQERANYFARQEEQWTEVADFVMRYETMLSNKTDVIERLAQTLSVQDYDSKAITRELEQLDYTSEGPKNRTYHKVNLFHRGHRTSVIADLGNSARGKVRG